MATNATTTTKAPAAPKPTKAAIAPVQRVTEILKKAALSSRITDEELAQVSTLVAALRTFIKA